LKPNYNLPRTAVQGEFPETLQLGGAFLRLANEYSRRLPAWNLKHGFGTQATAQRSNFDASIQEPIAYAR
jgi:hypothetical protein